MERTPESPPVPITITAAGELPAGTMLTDDNAPVFSGGGYPMWAEDQVCVGFDIGVLVTRCWGGVTILFGRECWMQGDQSMIARA
jgi:hypothetical protein